MWFIFFIASLFSCASLLSSEPRQYIYPVAAFEQQDGAHVLLLNQKSLEQIELYDWSAHTKTMCKILMSMYTPTSIKILPDGSGFSFVDNGRIRIKRFDKRSVKSLDIYEPIYGIEQISWLNNECCYFHAQSDGYYGIYQLTLEEELTPILLKNHTDYMYPVIIAQTLFFIERVKQADKYIYKFGTYDLNKKTIETLVNLGTKNFIMLTMHSLSEGFALEPVPVSGMEKFYYHKIFIADKNWQTHKLFDFSIPHDLLFNDRKRIYESLLPFIPRHTAQFIFFSSYDLKTERMILYKFDITTKKSMPAVQEDCSVFVPVFLGNQGWCGGEKFPIDLHN